MSMPGFFAHATRVELLHEMAARALPAGRIRRLTSMRGTGCNSGSALSYGPITQLVSVHG
jgi:hypothetical protein